MRTNTLTSNTEDDRVGVRDGLASWYTVNVMDSDATDREEPVNEMIVSRLEDAKGGKTAAAVDGPGSLQQFDVVEPSEGS